MMNFVKNIRGATLLSHSFLVVLFALTVFILLGMLNFGGRVGDLRLSIANIKLEIENLEKSRQEFLSVQESLENLEVKKTEVYNLVPKRNGVLRNIELLEAVAAQTLNTQTIDISETPPDLKNKIPKRSDPVDKLVKLPNGFDSVDFKISLSGDFTGLINYLYLFEHQPFLTFIQSIDLEAEQKNLASQKLENTGRVETEIEGNFFYTKD